MTYFLNTAENSQYPRGTEIAYYRCLVNAAQRRLNGESYESLLGVKAKVSAPIVNNITNLEDDRPNPQLHIDNYKFIMETSAEFEDDKQTLTVPKITKCMNVVDVSQMDTQDPNHKQYYYWYFIKNNCSQPINAFWCDNDSGKQYTNDCNRSNKAWTIDAGEKKELGRVLKLL